MRCFVVPISFAALALTACNNGGAWQPAYDPVSMQVQDADASQAAFSELNMLPEGTGAELERSSDSSGRKTWRARSLSENDCRNLLQRLAKRGPLKRIEILRVARFTPASWDLLAVEGEGGAYAHFVQLDRLYSESELWPDCALEELDLSKLEVRLNLRTRPALSELAEIEPFLALAQRTLAAAGSRYTQRKVEVGAKTFQMTYSLRLDLPATQAYVVDSSSAEQVRTWMWRGGPESAPQKDVARTAVKLKERADEKAH